MRSDLVTYCADCGYERRPEGPHTCFHDEAIAAAAVALVNRLPRCEQKRCGRPATVKTDNDLPPERYCDKHAPPMEFFRLKELRVAALIRAIPPEYLKRRGKR